MFEGSNTNRLSADPTPPTRHSDDRFMSSEGIVFSDIENVYSAFHAISQLHLAAFIDRQASFDFVRVQVILPPAVR